MSSRASRCPTRWGWALAALLGIGLTAGALVGNDSAEAAQVVEPSQSVGPRRIQMPVSTTSALATDVHQAAHVDSPLPSSPNRPALASQHYDDSALYPLAPTVGVHPATAQGVLSALTSVKPDVLECWQTYRSQHPYASSLATIEWRLAAQADGSTRVEGVSIATLVEAESLSGCLVRILTSQAFEAVPNSSARFSFLVELAL